MALFDAYLPAMAFAALFREDQSLHATPYENVRADMDKLLERAANASASEANRHPDLAGDALFAVCAFVDEAMLLAPWPGAGQWMRNTLQYAHFKETNAGVVFYDRLMTILQGGRDYARPLKPVRPASDDPRETVSAPGPDGVTLGPVTARAAADPCPPSSPPEPAAGSGYVSPLTGLPLASRAYEPTGEKSGTAPAAPDARGKRPQGILDYIESRKTLEVELPKRLLPFGRQSPQQESPSVTPAGLPLPIPSHAADGRNHPAARQRDGLPLTTAYLGTAGQEKDPAYSGAPSSLSLSAADKQGLNSASFSAKEEVAGLYAVALTLGFTGQYHAPETREQLRKATLAGLDASLAGRISLSETLITPEAYYMPSGAGRRKNLSPLLHAVLVAVPALFTLFVYLAYDDILSAYATEWLQKLGS